MAPRNLSSEQRIEFSDKLAEQFDPKCVVDPGRLCHAISTAVTRLEYDYKLGRIDEEPVLEAAKSRGLEIAKHCIGIEIDADRRTVCHFYAESEAK